MPEQTSGWTTDGERFVATGDGLWTSTMGTLSFTRVDGLDDVRSVLWLDPGWLVHLDDGTLNTARSFDDLLDRTWEPADWPANVLGLSHGAGHDGRLFQPSLGGQVLVHDLGGGVVDVLDLRTDPGLGAQIAVTDDAEVGFGLACVD